MIHLQISSLPQKKKKKFWYRSYGITYNKINLRLAYYKQIAQFITV